MGRYLIFGRTEYAEPLEHQGNLSAADDGEAKRLAVERFGERWVELVLIPEHEIHWVLREEPEMEASA